MSLHSLRQECEREIDNVHKLAERATALGDSRLDASIQELMDALNTLKGEAGKPARIGLIGGFSSGKTRLLEALLGCAGQLNVLVQPSTGNICEFELIASDVPQTVLEHWKVLFMSERQAARLLRRLLLEARREQQSEGFDNRGAATNLDKLLYEAEFGADERARWPEARRWAIAAYEMARGNKLKDAAFEICRLSDSVEQSSDWLGRAFKVINKSDAIQLMTLNYNPQEIYGQKDLSRWRAQQPSTSAPLGDTLENCAPETLKSLFPLVHKLMVQAKLPRALAKPLGDIRRLVDCPGSGADGSGIRDGALCAEELKDVDCVLALLNARNIGERREAVDSLLRIWGPAAKERILAVVSRFDELPHNRDESAGVRDRLAEGKEPLRAAELFSKITPFKTLYNGALDTVMDQDANRLVLVSSMAYITERLQEEKSCRRGTADFYKKELNVTDTNNPGYDNTLPWLREVEMWGHVARRLKQADDRESRAVASLLYEFSEDGGFTRLYKILEDHSSQYGQSLMLARLEPEFERISTAITELKAQVEEREKEISTAPESPEISREHEMTREQAIEALASAFSQLENNYITRRQKFLLKRRPPGRIEAVPVRDAIERWAIAEVFGWGEWRLLFQLIRPDEEPNLIKLVEPAAPDLDRDRNNLQDEQDTPVTPVKSSDFKRPFTMTLERVQNVLREWCSDSMKYHSEELQKELEKELGGQGAARAVANALGGADSQANSDIFGKARNLVQTLTCSSWLNEALPSMDDRTVSSFFPLQLPYDDRKPALYYAWHKPLYTDHPKQFDDRHRHIMYAVRLRQVLIDAVVVWLDDRLYAVRRSLEETVKKTVQDIAKDLRTEVKKLSPRLKPPVPRPPEE